MHVCNSIDLAAIHVHQMCHFVLDFPATLDGKSMSARIKHMGEVIYYKESP